MPKIYPPKRKPFRRVYTKTGDQGRCSIGSGKRVFKSDPVVEALGAVDELNAVIGVAQTQISKLKSPACAKTLAGRQIHNLKLKTNQFLEIQKDLFTVGAMLSRARQSNHACRQTGKKLLKTRVKFLEDQIDKLSQDLPELKNFILPGGSQVAAFLHLARAVCRRAERRVVRIHVKCPSNTAGRQMSRPPCFAMRSGQANVKDIIIYLNRLSDFLFALARWANYQTGSEEIKWTAKF